VQNIPVCANAVGGDFLISRDVLGKWLGKKSSLGEIFRNYGKFCTSVQVLHEELRPDDERFLIIPTSGHFKMYLKKKRDF
jgi:hypothetical protein